jgi:hypothetical protein
MIDDRISTSPVLKVVGEDPRATEPPLDDPDSTEEIPAGTLRQRKRRERLKRDPETERQDRLLRIALTKSDRGGIQEDVDWVYQNLRVTWNQIPIHSVPSPGAVALLGEAKADKKWFLEKYHAKLLPTKSKLEEAGWLDADDGQVAEMRARILEEKRIVEAEG